MLMKMNFSVPVSRIAFVLVMRVIRMPVPEAVSAMVVRPTSAPAVAETGVLLIRVANVMPIYVMQIRAVPAKVTPV